jgi:integrase
MDSRTARKRLKVGRQAHFEGVAPNCHLGYQRVDRGEPGRWIFRRYLGQKWNESLTAKSDQYQIKALGLADDEHDANGSSILDYAQAKAKALHTAATGLEGGRIERISVRQAFNRYIEHKKNRGQPVADALSRGGAHILPTLGDKLVSELTSHQLETWLANMARAPAQKRPLNGKMQERAQPKTDEEIRKRRSSSNRVLTMLKSVLNFAFDEGHVSNRDAWGRRLKPFAGVDVPRVCFLTIAEAQRLLNACDPDFRPIVRGALETGMRYSELARLQVADFHSDSGTLSIHRSKTGKGRTVFLTDQGTEFFKQCCLGRAGAELIFTRKGSQWDKSNQQVPMREACEHAKITPAISFHILRHTWASLSVMGGMPLMVVAKNLGHATTELVEKVYGHLAPSFIADAIRANAPRFNVKSVRGENVKPLRR